MREARIKHHVIPVADPATLASNLNRIADAVADAPDFDTEGVAEVREALARGAYEINVERIADKLIEIDEARRAIGRLGGW